MPSVIAKTYSTILTRHTIIVKEKNDLRFALLLNIQGECDSLVALCNQTVVVAFDHPGFAVPRVLCGGITGGVHRQMATFATRRNNDGAGCILRARSVPMTGSSTSVTAALAGFGTWLVAHICRWNNTLSSMARLITVMEVAIQTLAADLSAGWVALVAGDIGHLGLATHTLLGNKHNARGAGLAVWVARMVRQRSVTACASSGASVSAFGDRGTARNRRVNHGATASTGEFVKGGVHAGIAVSLVAEHLTGVNATLQLLAAGQGADVRFQSC